MSNSFTFDMKHNNMFISKIIQRVEKKDFNVSLIQSEIKVWPEFYIIKRFTTSKQIINVVFSLL